MSPRVRIHSLQKVFEQQLHRDQVTITIKAPHENTKMSHCTILVYSEYVLLQQCLLLPVRSISIVVPFMASTLHV